MDYIKELRKLRGLPESERKKILLTAKRQEKMNENKFYECGHLRNTMLNGEIIEMHYPVTEIKLCY